MGKCEKACLQREDIELPGKALITGASSGIGLEISKRLVEEGYEVYGIGRDFSEVEKDTLLFKCDRFHKVKCDLCDTQKLTDTVKKINENHDITLLINNAGVGYYGLHEEISPQKISQMVRTNLEAPMIISGLLLRDLKKNSGIIVNISSVTAEKTNPHGCAYGATKAGLTSFSHSLFDEARKYGVRVVNIEPDMTETNLYRNADFESDDDCAARLLPEEVADAVMFAVNQREGLVVTDISVKPQLHRIKRKLYSTVSSKKYV